MAVPFLHRTDCALADLGPWEPAQRYWRGNEPEYDVVARSVDGRRLLVGEAKWRSRPASAKARRPPAGPPPAPGIGDLAVVRATFAPRMTRATSAASDLHVVDGRAVFAALR